MANWTFKGRKRGDRRNAEGGLVGATEGSDLDGFGGVVLVSTPWTTGPAAGAEGVGFMSNLEIGRAHV